MSTAGSIAESQLGFTPAELLVLRQATEVAAQSRAGSATMPERGRGTSRHSQPSSRNASAASSRSIPGRVTMDSGSLRNLEVALTAMMQQLQARIEQVEDLSEQSVERIKRGAFKTMKEADEEMARCKKINAHYDELDEEMENTRKVCRRIREFREKCERLGGRMDQLQLARAGNGGRPPTKGR